MAVAVPVVLAVRLVVLVIVGDEVVEREAVVRRHEVDRGPRLAAAVGEQVGRGGEPRREIGQLPVVAAPVGSHRVAIAVVPFRPARREAADLVAAGPDVPRLGDQLDLAERRVLSAGVEETAVLVEAVRLAGQDGGEVEAEAVDAHVVGPVAQAVHHHLQHAAVGEVHRVAGAGVVDVVPRVGRQPVVGGVVDALEGEGRAELVAFRGVVVDHVEDQLEPGIVQMRHHLLELGEGEVGIGRIAPGGREEADRVVAPVVLQPLVEQGAVVDEGVHGQQFHRGDAERREVGGDLRAGEPRIGAAQRLGQRRMPLREPAHVRLVDDGVLPGDAPPAVAPGEGGVDDGGLLV